MLEHFLAREPAPDVRVELAIARLCEVVTNLWRDPRSGKAASSTDFLPFLDVWKRDIENDPRYSDVDREVFKALKG